MPAAAIASPRRSRTHVGLDGSRVSVSGVAVDVDRPASSFLTVYVNGRTWEFTGGHRTFGRDVAAESKIEFDERFSFQNDTICAGAVNQVVSVPGGTPDFFQTTFRIVVWEGRNYSVHTHVYDGSTAEALGAFDAFRLVETPDGVRMVRRQADKAPNYRAPDLLKEIPEIGLVHIRELTREAARSLPSWPGTRVRGGELFTSGSAAGDTCGEASFTLVGATSVASVMPEASTASDTVVAGLQELVVDWQGA
jgi:hypothetical protein